MLQISLSMIHSCPKKNGSSGIWSDGLMCAIPSYDLCILSTIMIKRILALIAYRTKRDFSANVHL